MRKKNLIHPGEILLEEFLKPMNISQNQLAIANYDLAVAESGVWSTVKRFIPEFNIRAACL